MINLLKTAEELFSDDTNKANKSFVVDSIIGTVLLALKKYNETDANVFIYAANNYDANSIFNKLSSLIDEDKIVLLPGDDLIRVEYISESKEVKSELIYGLYKIRHSKHSIVIVTPSTLYRHYPSVKTFDDSFIEIRVGDELNINDFKNKLSELGYISVSKIDQSMEYASRGGVIDVFSLNYEDPIRIEFFDTVIESIRLFKIETQTSYKKLDNAILIPATINLLTEEEKAKTRNKILNQLNKDLLNKREEDKEELIANVNEDIEQILNNSFSNKYYKYLSFLLEKPAELTDFADNFIVIVANKQDFNKAKSLLFEEATKFLLELHDKNKNISHLSYFNERASIFKGSLETTILEPFYNKKDDISIPIRSLTYLDPKGSTPLIILETLIKGRNKILIIYHSEEEGKEIKRLLDSTEIEYSETENYMLNENTPVSLCQGKFNVSFEIINQNAILLASDDLLYDKRKIKAYSTHFKKGKVLESYEELEPGDYVVHEKYGIGKDYYAHVSKILKKIKQINPDIILQLNTVLFNGNINFMDELYEEICKYDIDYWKIIRFLPIRGKAYKEKDNLSITDEQFDEFTRNFKNRKQNFEIIIHGLKEMERKHIIVLSSGKLIYSEKGKDEEIKSLI